MTPFHDSHGNLVFPWIPTSDRAFIHPSPPPETFFEGGLITIPEIYREEYRQGYGILLGIGPGFFNVRGRWNRILPELTPGRAVVYDVTVPWRALAKGADGQNYLVTLCGAGDILGVVLDG